MKTFLLFIPLLVGTPSAGPGYTNIQLGYCCLPTYTARPIDCWQSGSYRGMPIRVPAKTEQVRASNDPVAIKAAIDELIQRAQFACDGVT